MSEKSFGEMLDEQGSFNVRRGQVIEGKVISVKPEEMVVNIYGKSDGILTKEEYSNNDVDLTTVAKEGDTITVKVINANDKEGYVLLSYKDILADESFKEIEAAFNDKSVLTGKVISSNDHGIVAVVKETRVFIPGSLVSDRREKDFSKFEGQDIEFRIQEFDPSKRRIIGNRKDLLLERKAEATEKLLSELEVGQVVEGDIKNITKFGAFVDLGAGDGLLHISEMSWGRVEKPEKIFKVGDHVKCYVKEINGTKIALSCKFPESNPWLNAEEKYAKGTVVKGKIARMADFGAFVVLEPGVDALLHVSQISLDRIDKPSDVLKSGQEIEAKVVDIRPEDHKISLSIKALLEDRGETPSAVAEDAAEEDAEDVAEKAVEDAEVAETTETAETTDDTTTDDAE